MSSFYQRSFPFLYLMVVCRCRLQWFFDSNRYIYIYICCFDPWDPNKCVHWINLFWLPSNVILWSCFWAEHKLLNPLGVNAPGLPPTTDSGWWDQLPVGFLARVESKWLSFRKVPNVIKKKKMLLTCAIYNYWVITVVE